MVEVEERWNALNDKYAATFNKAKEKCKPFKQLIAFLGEISSELESIKPTKAVHEDYATLAQYASEFPKHMATLSELLKEKDVEGLKKFDAAAPTYTEALPRFGYLEILTESGLFEAYRAALLHDTEKCFPADFTQENRERYYRLKFRALNAARSQDKKDQQKVNLSFLALQKSSTELCARAITRQIPDLDTQFQATSKLLTDMKSLNGVGSDFTLLLDDFQGRLKKILADFKSQPQPQGPPRAQPQEEAKSDDQPKIVPSKHLKLENQE
jgi:hypothetical protein